MSWYKLDDSMPDHPKVRRLARALEVSRREAVGLLAILWCQVCRFAPDGDLSDYEAADVEALADWDGEPGALVVALVSAGLLDETDEGLVVHDWAERAEGYRRAQARARARQSRQCRDIVATSGRDSVATSPDIVAPEERRGEEKRGQEKKIAPRSTSTKPAAPPDDGPVVLTYPTQSKLVSWGLTEKQLCEWRELYPGVDVLAECRKALAYVQATPAKCKTPKGMPRFLVNWLNRATDSGRPRAPPPRGGRQASLGDMAIDGYDQARAEVEREM